MAVVQAVAMAAATAAEWRAVAAKAAAAKVAEMRVGTEAVEGVVEALGEVETVAEMVAVMAAE